ncbi:MAG: YciI family protein [Candidatus Saccharicenans sp.]
MTFLVLGFDHPAPEGPARRQSCRPSHLQLGESLHRQGRWLYAAALLNDSGEPIGSVIICEFDSQEQLENEWLSREPYILNRVWQKVEIFPIRPAPFLT